MRVILTRLSATSLRMLLGASVAATALSACGAGKRATVNTNPVVRASTASTTTSSRPAPPPAPLLGRNARSTFAQLAAGLPGPVGLAAAPLGGGPVEVLGSFSKDRAWSTMKVPVLVTLLRDYARARRALSPAQRDEATRALEQSDNAAAEALFSDLEHFHGGLIGASNALQAVLGAAGDTQTVINTAPNDQGFTTWGQSIWSGTGEVLFYRSLADRCLLSSRQTNFVLGLMQNVVASQRWGAGAAGYPPTTPLAFKAGWGPERGGYLVRQTAIVGASGHGYVFSVLAKPDSGSFDDGVQMVTAVAQWARQSLKQNASTGVPQQTCSPAAG